jgi:hypothetical protein
MGPISFLVMALFFRRWNIGKSSCFISEHDKERHAAIYNFHLEPAIAYGLYDLTSSNLTQMCMFSYVNLNIR